MREALTKNQMLKRENTVFAVYEWSDRDADFDIYQLGGLHYAPLGKKRDEHDPKILVDHYAQQRFYAAIMRLMNAERGYSEALHFLLDFASVAVRLNQQYPELFDKLLAEVIERKRPNV